VTLGLVMAQLFLGAFAVLVLLRQQGRILIRLEAIERDLLIERLQGAPLPLSEQIRPQVPKSEDPLAKSRINRHGLAVGSTAPDFRARRLEGDGYLSLTDFKGKRVLLLFVSADCAPCDVLLRELTRVGDGIADDLLIVARGSVDALQRKFADQEFATRVGVQEAWEISRLYATFKMPSAYVIDEHGTIAAGPTVGPSEIISMSAAIDPSFSMTTAH